MTPLTYLTTADRNRLDQLKEIAGSSRFPKEERIAAQQEIAEIEARRKPLTETTYEEAQEFRIFLFQKFRKLAAVGAGQQAFQFQQYIAQIEQRMMQIQFENTKKALAEEQAKVEVGKGLRQNDRRVATRRIAVSNGAPKNPWAIPVDDED